MEEIIENFVEEPIKVYVKINADGYITDINSEIFIKDFTDWIEIDKGYGDKFSHAQSQYFDKPIINENGEYTYYLKGGKVYGN